VSDRDFARHRAPQRALTPLSDVGDALTGRLAVVGRSGAVLAVSTGILATGGLPTQAQSLETVSAVTSTNALAAGTAFIAAGPATLLSSAPDTARGAPLRAPMAATVLFETSDFQAVPTVVHHAPAKPASHLAAPVKAAAVKAVRAKAAHAKPAAPAKPAAAKPARKKAAHAKAPAVKAPAAKPEVKPAKAKPKKATSHKAPAAHTTAPAKHKAPAKAKKKAPAASATRGSAVLSIAARYVGTPYVYGGTSPRGFDCSGYTSYVYRQLGIHIPRTANQQMMATTHISRSKARAGDLVFFVSGGRAYHVGIYAGNGMMYDSPHTGARVSKRAIWSAAVIFGRVTG
jgi:peptidoglycan DL-endopeptidase CwlO